MIRLNNKFVYYLRDNYKELDKRMWQNISQRTCLSVESFNDSLGIMKRDSVSDNRNDNSSI